ncbi:MAG TPA: flagellar export protein FliJ [Halomonas sp.]|nr:flagellar export protein FliJ [Halomonas sp.]
MKRHDRPLDTLISLAQEARDQAIQSLADEQRSARQIADQLAALGAYRQEYAARLNATMREGISPSSMHNYQQFLASLDDAMARAQRALADQQQRVGHSQQHWQRQQQRLASYDTLAQRRRTQRRREEQRREQRLSDDLVNSRLARRRRSNGS